MMTLVRPVLLIGLIMGLRPSEPLRAAVPSASQVEPQVDLVVSPTVQMHDLRRIGMNLGIWTSWGAEQLGANIIKNPGFEGVVDGALATVKHCAGAALILEGLGVQRPDGFWNGASIRFRTGVSAGKSAQVRVFYRESDSNGIRVELDSEIPAMTGDVVALTKLDDLSPASQWWFSSNQVNCHAGPPRPGSPGIRSLVLCPAGSERAEANSFLDETTARSGKMLLIRGKWRFSIWTKKLSGASRLRVSFSRAASHPFFVKDVVPALAWRQIVIDFDATDDDPDGPLQLQISAAGNGRIAVDDVSLSAVADGTFPFRREVVAALQELRPGYLRDWQGQLGDSVSNRLAPPFARRASRYRSGRQEDAKYEYSIPEFLQLCERMGAIPWLVLPTTASDVEYVQLGTYLAHAQARMHLGEILVEFGNENWNPLFGAAGIQDPKSHAEAASRAFQSLRKGCGSSIPLRTVMNAQFANLPAVAALVRGSVADLVAVAPYFAYELPSSAAQSQVDAALFSSERVTFAALADTALQNHKELAVYEVNLHTTGGSAGSVERDRFVLSSEAGSALAMRLIDGLSAGLKRQCVYTLVGFDTYTSDRSEFVQLWGVIRDLSGAPRLRSTGVSVSMLNQAMQSDLHEVQLKNGDSRNLSVVAFHGSRGWTAAIVSGRSEPIMATLLFPAVWEERVPAASLTLGVASEGAGGSSVKYGHTTIARHGADATVSVTIPPRSLVVLLTEPLKSATSGVAR